MIQSGKQSTQAKKSLFQINAEISDILDSIEEAGGEITAEDEEKLRISQDELADKLESYANAIRYYKLKTDACKQEKKRINDIQKRDEKVVDRLNKAVGDAVMMWGDVNKSGSRFIETGLTKITAKPSKAIEIDSGSLKVVMEAISAFIDNRFKEFNGDVPDLWEKPEEVMAGMLDYVNGALRKYADNCGTEPVVLEFDELASLPVTYKASSNIVDLVFTSPTDAAYYFCNPEITIEPALNATNAKTYAEQGLKFPFAKTKDSYVLTIK